jgi:hypothetical protein
MRDEPIYLINQHSLLKRPKIWSKRDFILVQIISAIIGIPIIVLLVEVGSLPLSSSLVIILASSGGGAIGFWQGRRRAERYKIELATGGPTPFYGKYPFERVKDLRRN